MRPVIEIAVKKIQRGLGTLLIDIDGTLTDTPNTHYGWATPDESVIAIVNELYDRGNCIKIFSSRGSSSGIDQRPMTINQLKDWGVNYHELIMNKPSHDLHVDDATITAEELLCII